MMHKQNLVVLGLLLFLLGLFLGGAIQSFTNPRMALAAHMSAIQGGIVLLALAALWDCLKLSRRWQTFTACAFVVGLYEVPVALALAAAWGTSQATPIAGAGFAGTDAHESIVTALLTIGSIATVLGAIPALCGAIRHRAASKQAADPQ